jgi:hypothetical protein
MVTRLVEDPAVLEEAALLMSASQEHCVVQVVEPESLVKEILAEAQVADITVE